MKVFLLQTKAQDGLARWLGCEPAQRPEIVLSMMHRNSNAGGYWLPLLVSVAIATLGLVLGSTAVVIGAMLIAPMMRPILSLAMGLAVGSPFLVVRSSSRILASVVVVVGSSALITRLLPYHELNAELAARTKPTAIDLFVAAFCAVAGVYASLRRDSDVAVTAAGTSIGISLVPPLCASGYGVGTLAWPVANGALLLFLTNVVAIVVVGTLSFAAAGFGRVDIRDLEAQELGTGTGAPVARRLARLFASRSGRWIRLLMPLVLLGLVYLPLKQALDEVVWQIRTRKDVQQVMAAIPYRLVQSHLLVAQGKIELTAVLLGSAADASAVRAQIAKAIVDQTGVKPQLEILAIPDAQAFAGLEATLEKQALPAAARQLSPSADIDRAFKAIGESVTRRWPANAAGKVLSVSVTDTADAVRLEVAHLGAALDNSAREALESVLREDLGHSVALDDLAFPSEQLVVSQGSEMEAMERLAPLLQKSRNLQALSVCVEAPTPAAKAGESRRGARDSTVASPVPLIRHLLEEHPRAHFTSSDQFAVRFVTGACPLQAAAAAAAAAAAPSASARP